MRNTVLFLPLFLVCCAAPAPEPPMDVSASEVLARPIPPEPEDPWEADDVRTGLTSLGTYTVHWRPVGGFVPKNEHFELEVWIFENREGAEPVPVTDAIIILSGWMPDHGHGMIRQPRSSDNGDGSYRVQGMLFHMGGHWEVFIDLIVDNLSERAEFALDL